MKNQNGAFKILTCNKDFDVFDSYNFKITELYIRVIRVPTSTVKFVEMLNLAKTLRIKEDGLIERGCCEEL